MPEYIKDFLRYIHIFFLQLRSSCKKQIKVEGKCIFIAPHPDDEALGCGGLISHLCAEGWAPHVIIMTGGGGSIKRGEEVKSNIHKITEEDIIRERRKLTLKSAHEIGLPEENIHFLDFIDGHISERSEKEMKRLNNLLNEIKPDNLFVPHSREGWPDHIATRSIVLSQLKNQEKKNNSKSYKISNSQKVVPQIFEYCVWIWYYNVWNLDWKNAYKFLMSKSEHKAKLRAVNAYIKSLAPNGKPWSGVLPKPFIFANTLKTELYFKVL